MLLPTCKCCGCECCRTKTYSYTDTEPPGKLWDECPTVGQCGGVSGGGVAGSCANEVLEGFIIERFCKQSVKGKKITAKLRKNSIIDDSGSVAGIETDKECGRLGKIAKDHDITDALVIEEDPDDAGYLLAKVPFRAVNANHGGPYGLAAVTICWCCIKEGDPPCKCCEENCEKCCRKKTYSYKDTEPKGKWYDECPRVGNCDGKPGDCGNDVLEGFIIERFCKTILDGLVLHATLRANSAIDDYGSVAGIETNEKCGSLGIIARDHDITDQIVIEDDPDDSAYVLAKVPFRAVNANHGGPYGLSAVHICWCCTPPDDPPCDCCKNNPPPPPPKKYECRKGDCLEVRDGTYDEPTCGGKCAECVSNADCGCVEFGSVYYPALDAIVPGFGCCPQGTYFDPAVGYCWAGEAGTESAATESRACCDGKCVKPFLPQPDNNGNAPCKLCSVCDGKGFSGGPYADFFSMLDAYAALGVSWPLSETLCNDGFYFETCPQDGNNPLP